MKKYSSIFIIIIIALIALIPPLPMQAQTPMCEVVFQTNRDGNYELYVMNEDGTNQTRITNTSEYERNPSWSPDGSMIAYEDDALYVIDRNATILSSLDLVQNPDWGPEKIIGRYKKDLIKVGFSNSLTLDLTQRFPSPSIPRWSPDGMKIAYLNSSDKISIVNEDFSNNTDTNISLSLFGLNWSSDGTKFIFSKGIKSSIYIVNIDGTNEICIFSDAYNNRYPTYINNEKIIFESNKDGLIKLYSINADGSDLTLLTPLGGEQADVWCPPPPPPPTPTPTPTPLPPNTTIVPELEFSGDLSGMSTIADEQVDLWAIDSPISPYLYAMAMGLIIFFFIVPIIRNFIGKGDE